MSLEIKDLGIGKLKAEIQRLKTLRVTLGVQGAEAREIHPVAEVAKGLLAFWLHYGTKRMPARPWVDRAIAEVQDTVLTDAKRGVADLIDRRASDAVDVMSTLGKGGLKAMVKVFDSASEWAEPLAPQTVERKGHNQPLVDTGAIRDAQSYAVRDGDKILKQRGVRDG